MKIKVRRCALVRQEGHSETWPVPRGPRAVNTQDHPLMGSSPPPCHPHGTWHLQTPRWEAPEPCVSPEVTLAVPGTHGNTC